MLDLEKPVDRRPSGTITAYPDENTSASKADIISS